MNIKEKIHTILHGICLSFNNFQKHHIITITSFFFIFIFLSPLLFTTPIYASENIIKNDFSLNLALIISLCQEILLLGILITFILKRKTKQIKKLKQERLDLAIEATSDGLWDWNIKTGQVYWSSQCFEMLGYTPNKFPVTYEVWQTLIHPDDLKFCELALQYSLISGDPFNHELRYKSKNGAWQWTLTRGLSVKHDQNKKSIRMVGTHTNISKQKQTEESLQKSEDQYRALIETSQDLIWECDKEGRYIFLNEAWEKKFGYSTYEMIGEKFTKFQSPDNAKTDLEMFSRLMRGERIAELKTTHLKKDGKDITLIFNATCVRNHKGIIVGTRGTAHDITEAEKIAFQYQLLFSSMLDGFALHEIILDDNGIPTDYRFIQINNAFEKMTGLDKNIIGKTVKEILPNTEDLWIKNYGEVALTGKIIQFENYSQALNKYFEVCAFCPEPGKFACVFRDITERKQIEEKTKKNELELRAIFENAPLIMLLVDQDRKVIKINNQGLVAARRTHAESTGLRGGEALRCVNASRDPRGCGFAKECDHCGIRNAVSKTFESKMEIYRKESSIPYNSPTGQKDLHVLVSTTCLDILDEKLVLVCLEDITQQKQLENQLRQSEKMKAIGQLAGGIAHDFNNILGAIMGYAEMSLEDSDISDFLKNNISKILSAGERASLLINQILTFSRKDSENKEPIYIKPVIKEVIEMLKVSMPPTVQIQSNLITETLPILADPTKIHEIIMNLSANAAYAIKNNGTIIIQLDEKEILSDFESNYGIIVAGFYSVITIKDNGCGMNEEDLLRIFDPFYTTKKVGDGTGLGLSVVFGIIQNYKGGITVESTVNGGTTVSVFLPTINQTFDANEHITADISIVGGKERIMLVDDEEMLLDINKNILTNLGYCVTVFNESEKALNAFASDPKAFDLIITDQTMPVMTGIELSEKFIKMNSEIKIILCSGYNTEISEKNLFQIGIHEIMKKPFSKKDLATKIRDILDKNSQF